MQVGGGRSSSQPSAVSRSPGRSELAWVGPARSRSTHTPGNAIAVAACPRTFAGPASGLPTRAASSAAAWFWSATPKNTCTLSRCSAAIAAAASTESVQNAHDALRPGSRIQITSCGVTPPAARSVKGTG